jgi:NADPH:quinone reductase-like Zn-dependent oxidoreductase
MKAVVHERYGPPDVLELREVPTPTPKDNEVRIRIHATTVTSGDRRVRSLDVPPGFGLLVRLIFGIRRPRGNVVITLA